MNTIEHARHAYLVDMMLEKVLQSVSGRCFTAPCCKACCRIVERGVDGLGA